MYVEALEDGLTVSFTKKATSGSLYYSLDKQEWNELSGETPAVNSGEKVYFKGDLVPGTRSGIGEFSINKQCNVAGNIMSLLFADDFVGKTDLTGYDYAFKNLFNGCTTIQSAKNLILSATTLANYCYHFMFYGCSSLTSAPELPATTLASYCYQYMFTGCTSLTSAPELPATTLAEHCYNNMFSGCTSLTTAPELPATTLAEHCYNNMFSGCTSLTSAPELPATTLAEHCYNNMFQRCTSLTSAPELPATTLANYCYDGIFYGCSGLTSAPELPATTLAEYCYQSMFSGCTVLTSAPELPATTLADCCYQNMFYDCSGLTSAPELPATMLTRYCYSNMFKNCTNLTSAPELPATTLADGCYNSMFWGCTSLNYIKMLATDISASSCLNYWVKDVSSTGTFVKANGVEIPTGTSGIPEGWTVQTVWETMANGVYAVGADGNPVMVEDADESCTAVALITDNQKIMIAKNDDTDGTNITLTWGLSGKDVTGITNILSADIAQTDFNGKTNTAAIIAAYTEHGVEMNSRDMCKALQDFNTEEQVAGRTGDWYIPACGQLYEMYQNRTAIEEMLAIIGGTAYAGGSYWSSSGYDSRYVWGVSLTASGYMNNYNKLNESFVRFVQNLN